MAKVNVQNANVAIAELGVNADTNANGNCSFDVPPGTYNVTITHDDFETKTVSITVGNTDKSEQIEIFRKVVTPPDPYVFNGQRTIWTQDANGNTLSGVTVRFTLDGYYDQTLTTGSDGKCTFTNTPVESSGTNAAMQCHCTKEGYTDVTETVYSYGPGNSLYGTTQVLQMLPASSEHVYYNSYISIWCPEEDTIRDGNTVVIVKDSSNNSIPVVQNTWMQTDYENHMDTIEHYVKRELMCGFNIPSNGNYTISVSRDGYTTAEHTFSISLNSQRKYAIIAVQFYKTEYINSEFIGIVNGERVGGRYGIYDFKFTDKTSNKPALLQSYKVWNFYSRPKNEVSEENEHYNQDHPRDFMYLYYSINENGSGRFMAEQILLEWYYTDGTARLLTNNTNYTEYEKQFISIVHPLVDGNALKVINVSLTRVNPKLLWED